MGGISQTQQPTLSTVRSGISEAVAHPAQKPVSTRPVLQAVPPAEPEHEQGPSEGQMEQEAMDGAPDELNTAFSDLMTKE
jgi:hypothetical protein